MTCLSKNMMVYWRNTEYNAVRLFSTCFLAFLFGSIYWGLGSTRWVPTTTPMAVSLRRVLVTGSMQTLPLSQQPAVKPSNITLQHQA